MNHEIAVIMLVVASTLSGPAIAQDAAAAKTRARGGVALQLDLSSGGDEITSATSIDAPYPAHAILGEGMTLSLGGFYRPSESRPWEVQAFIGHKSGWLLPVRGGGNYADVSRWVFQLLANYRHENKWYFGGGLVLHANPTYEDTTPGVADVNFDDAVGATVEGGWSWVGVQCTYIEYHAAGYGSLDASNCGVRFTWRFRKWRPLR